MNSPGPEAPDKGVGARLQHKEDRRFLRGARRYIETGRVTTSGPTDEFADDPVIRRAYMGI